MAGLTGLTPKDSYKKLLIVSAASLNSALSRIRDGAGNAAPIEMSDTDILIIDTGKFMFGTANAYIYSAANDELTIVADKLTISTPVSFKGRTSFANKVISLSAISVPTVSATLVKGVSANLSAKIRAISFIGYFKGNVEGNTVGRHVGSVSLNQGNLNFDTSGNTCFNGGTSNTIITKFGGNARIVWGVSDFEPYVNGDIYLGRTNRWKGGKFVALTASAFTVSDATIKKGVIDNTKIGITTPASLICLGLKTTGIVNLNSQELHMVNGGNTKMVYSGGFKFVKGSASLSYTGTAFFPLDDQVQDLGRSGAAWKGFRCKNISAIEDVTLGKNVTMTTLPTSSAGLTTGMLYNLSGALKIKA
jgi:hypothetical protein